MVAREGRSDPELGERAQMIEQKTGQRSARDWVQEIGRAHV